MPLLDSWIANRTKNFDSSGIRKMFDLAAKLKDPINLSIGQPDFEVPRPVKDALIQAINDNKNGYALTQGIPVLREKLQAEIDARYGHADRKVFVCSGTSGGLVLAIMSLINPGEEVIYFDPYFVMYPALVELANGKSVKIDTYPNFQIDLEQLEDAISDRTKMIILNSPSNPTGVCYPPEQLRAVGELAAQKGICVVSDEIYSKFIYGQEQHSVADFNERTVVIDGFSKSYAMTGLRVGYVHGPAELINTMIKVQQFTFVCAPIRHSGRVRLRWIPTFHNTLPSMRSNGTGSSTGSRITMNLCGPMERFTCSPDCHGEPARSFANMRSKTT